MKLAFIDLDKLYVSKTNMRYAKRPPDISDLLPTVRAKGVLQTLLVRDGDAPDTFEIMAGRRRYYAASAVAAERAEAGESAAPEPLPCAMLGDTDDASAIEISLIENFARLDADEVQQWVTFTRLVKEGRSLEEISQTFGLPELAVKRVLALGNLLPRIRTLYADDQIDRVTVRQLTLATKRQQQDWLALHDDPQSYPPMGSSVKAWLLGGAAIPVDHALFDVDASGLAIVADLFGADRCFADAQAFWAAQNAEIDARRAAYIAAGWGETVLIPPGEYFHAWEYDKTPKRRGGKVYIVVRSTGEVAIHEGYLSRREVERATRGASSATEAKPARAEVTSALDTYVALHRHAAVRADLLAHPGVALRLMVAHAIVGSHSFRVSPDPQSTRDDETQASVVGARGDTLFAERRRAILGVLGADPDDPSVTGGNGDGYSLVALFTRLLELPDSALMDVIAVVMGEALVVGHEAVDAVALTIGTDMADWWDADPAFLSLVRDKAVLQAIVAEVAGTMVCEANAKETGKTLKTIIAHHLSGRDGRNKVERWVPKWMAFPPSHYTTRGGAGSVRAYQRAIAARDDAASRAPDASETVLDAARLDPEAPPRDHEATTDAGDEQRLAA